MFTERWVEPSAPEPPEDPVVVVGGESAPLSVHLDSAIGMAERGEERAAMVGLDLLKAIREALKAAR